MLLLKNFYHQLHIVQLRVMQRGAVFPRRRVRVGDERPSSQHHPRVCDALAPCIGEAPVLEDVANEQGDKIRVVKLDVDANPITAGRFGVRAIPTMIVFKNGREADRIVGSHPKPQLMQKLTPHLGTA